MNKKRIGIGSFGLVTNGKANQKQLAIFIAEHSVDVEYMNDCYVAMSRDQYHDPVEKNYLKAFSFYANDKEHDDKNWRLFSEGRGAALSTSNPVSVYPLCVEEYNGELAVEDMLHISANGNVLSCCDLSYDHGDQIAYGNVLKEPLIDIVRREKDEEDEEAA